MLLMPLVDRFNAVSCLSSVKRGGRERRGKKLNMRHLEREQKKQEEAPRRSSADNSQSDRMRTAPSKSSAERELSKEATAVPTRRLRMNPIAAHSRKDLGTINVTGRCLRKGLRTVISEGCCDIKPSVNTHLSSNCIWVEANNSVWKVIFKWQCL